MKLLLDTHTFIGWNSKSIQLSQRALELCNDSTNRLLFSVVSAWEIQIKVQLGKLSLNEPLSEMIENQQQTNNLEILPITLNHVLALNSLPLHHKDPFDRLLIAQTISEEAVIVSRDGVFENYPVTVEW